jgi:hypothetical protein
MKGFSGPKSESDAARSSSTRPEALAGLAASEYNFVREAVAENLRTPRDVLERLVPRTLAKEDDFRIAAALLANDALPASACERIAAALEGAAADLSPRDFYGVTVVERLFQHAATPRASFASLLRGPAFPKHLRGRVARERTRSDALELLGADPSENVRARAAKALKSKTDTFPPNA